MESRVVCSEIIEHIGEYGIVKSKEETLFDNGKIFKRTTWYDVCLEHGEGDIVASFNKIIDARKWVKEN